MPKTSFDICSEKRQQQAALGALIRGYAQTKGKTFEEIGNIMGCSRPTASKKMNDPGEFTIKELQALQKELDVPVEVLQAVVNNLF